MRTKKPTLFGSSPPLPGADLQFPAPSAVSPDSDCWPGCSKGGPRDFRRGPRGSERPLSSGKGAGDVFWCGTSSSRWRVAAAGAARERQGHRRAEPPLLPPACRSPRVPPAGTGAAWFAAAPAAQSGPWKGGLDAEREGGLGCDPHTRPSHAWELPHGSVCFCLTVQRSWVWLKMVSLSFQKVKTMSRGPLHPWVILTAP